MTHRRAVLALPVLFLLLSLDRVLPEHPLPMAPVFVSGWDDVAPTLPGRDEGRFGLPGDPLNLVFVADPATLSAALTAAGWTRVPRSVRGSLGAGLAEWFDGRRLAAFPPMNDYRLLGRPQDENWALPVRGISARHHFRLWLTGAVSLDGRPFWWGSANRDLSIRWRDFSHRPDPDADAERDFIVRSLSASPLVESVVLAPLARIPRSGVNDKGYPFVTDGRAAVIVLRPPRLFIRRRAAAPAAASARARAPRPAPTGPAARPTAAAARPPEPARAGP